MNALAWKKYKWITQNLKNFSYFFIVPIVIMMALFFLTKNNEASVCYFPLISVLLGLLFDHMDIENIIHKEYAMYTSMSLKKSWIYNAVISWSFRLLYSVTIMAVGLIAYKIAYGCAYATVSIFLQGILNGVLSFGIILFATQCEVDLSVWKQYLSFIWVLPVLLCALMCEDKIGGVIPTGISVSIYLLLFSAILGYIALTINKNVSIEKFILSLDGVKKIASVRFNVMD